MLLVGAGDGGEDGDVEVGHHVDADVGVAVPGGTPGVHEGRARHRALRQGGSSLGLSHQAGGGEPVGELGHGVEEVLASTGLKGFGLLCAGRRLERNRNQNYN